MALGLPVTVLLSELEAKLSEHDDPEGRRLNVGEIAHALAEVIDLNNRQLERQLRRAGVWL